MIASYHEEAGNIINRSFMMHVQSILPSSSFVRVSNHAIFAHDLLLDPVPSRIKT